MRDLGAPRPTHGAEAAPAVVAPRSRSRLARWFDSWMRSVGIAFVLFLIVKTFLVEAFQIPSGSMENTILVGDFLFVNKAVYGAQIPGTHARLPGFETPQRGDVIVFAYPRNPELNYVKRVIGAPGDTVQSIAARIYVNGVATSEPYAEHTDPTHDWFDPDFLWQRDFLADTSALARARYRPTRDTWGPIVVPPHKYFVLGDNRDNSEDSRYWGFVDVSAIRGRPLIVYYSYDREAHDPFGWLTDIRWSRLGSRIR